ncbi:unnamed protein product, partial [Rotaria sordida]
VNLINNQTTTILLDFLLLLLPPPTYDDSPLLDLLFNTIIKQKYEDKHSYWFWKHLCFIGKTDESMYTINLTNNQTTTLADSSLLLLLLSPYDDSPLLDLLFNITTKRKYEDKHSYVYEQINTTPKSEIF